jgi:hypothetical protein
VEQLSRSVCHDNNRLTECGASLSFDPNQSVLVAGGLPPGLRPDGGNRTPGAVQFQQYAPRDIRLKADVAAPAVLLLNDRFDPLWTVSVDGRPANLLRCNFIMRGVYLEPGLHAVRFRFQPPVWPFYVSLGGLLAGLLLLGTLGWAARRDQTVQGAPRRESRPDSRRSHPKSNDAAAAPRRARSKA